MGTTIGYIAIATNPDYYKEKLNLFVQLSPVVELKNTKSMFLKYFAKMGMTIFNESMEKGFWEFYGKHWFGDYGNKVKGSFKPLKIIRKSMVPNKEWDDPESSGILENHFPHGASAKTL